MPSTSNSCFSPFFRSSEFAFLSLYSVIAARCGAEVRKEADVDGLQMEVVADFNLSSEYVRVKGAARDEIRTRYRPESMENSQE